MFTFWTKRPVPRVESLTDAQVKAYLDSYSSILANRRINVIRFGTYAHTGGIELNKLDEIYQAHQHLASTDKPRGNWRHRQLCEIVAWSQLRSRNDGKFLANTGLNSNKSCQLAFVRASKHLLEQCRKKYMKLRGSDIVEDCMRMLCKDLHGIGVKEASAIVAAWSPLGVYMSDELLDYMVGHERRKAAKNEWQLYNDFYEKAMEVVRETQLTPRTLEKLVWCMYHTIRKPDTLSIMPPSSSSSPTPCNPRVIEVSSDSENDDAESGSASSSSSAEEEEEDGQEEGDGQEEEEEEPGKDAELPSSRIAAVEANDAEGEEEREQELIEEEQHAEEGREEEDSEESEDEEEDKRDEERAEDNMEENIQAEKVDKVRTKEAKKEEAKKEGKKRERKRKTHHCPPSSNSISITIPITLSLTLSMDGLKQAKASNFQVTPKLVVSSPSSQQEIRASSYKGRFGATVESSSEGVETAEMAQDIEDMEDSADRCSALSVVSDDDATVVCDSTSTGQHDEEEEERRERPDKRQRRTTNQVWTEKPKQVMAQRDQANGGRRRSERLRKRASSVF